jgi:hypothetical protein
MYYAPLLAGGVLAIYLLSHLIEWAIVRRIADSQATGIPLSVTAAVVLAVVIYGFGAADGGPWTPGGLFIYPPAGLIVAIARVVAYRRRTASAE